MRCLIVLSQKSLPVTKTGRLFLSVNYALRIIHYALESQSPFNSLTKPPQPLIRLTKRLAAQKGRIRRRRSAGGERRGMGGAEHSLHGMRRGVF